MPRIGRDTLTIVNDIECVLPWFQNNRKMFSVEMNSYVFKEHMYAKTKLSFESNS